jgi:hypothetical protein
MTPPIIDLALAGETMDGAHIYAPPFQAALIQSGAALGRLCCEHPRETGGVLTVAAWATATGYFLYQALQPSQRPARKRAK